MDKRVFKATEIDSHRKGWIANLSPADVVNPDCYWSFSTRWQAEHFVALIDSGIPAHEAQNEVDAIATAAASLGKMRSVKKAAASRTNGKRGGRPKKVV